MGDLSVEIAGSPAQYRAGTLSISGIYGSRKTCTFQTVDHPPYTNVVEEGQTIEIFDGATLIFGGTVETIDEEINMSGNVRFKRITGIDYNQLADRHLVAYSYYSDPTNTVSINSAEVSATGTNLNDQMVASITLSPKIDVSDIVLDGNGEIKPTVYLKLEWKCDHPDALRSTTGASLYFNGETTFKVRRISDFHDDYLPTSEYSTVYIPISEFYVPDGYSDVDFTQIYQFKWIDYVGSTEHGPITIYFKNVEFVEAWSIGNIFRDIVSRFFAYGGESDDINVDNVEDGEIIEKATFNYIPASQAFDELADLTGMVWWIDDSANLYLTTSDKNIAPVSISETSYNWRNLKISSSRDKYRNRQFIRAGTAITNSRADAFVAEADQTIFELPYKVNSITAVTENGTPKTIGISGLNTGKDYYYTHGSKSVVADVAPGVGVVVVFTYTGLFPILVNQALDSEILARRALEGGSGVYEMIADEPGINLQSMATLKALAYLRKYGVIPKTITFETDAAGLRPGQLVPADLPSFGLADDYLIESLSIKDIGGTLTRTTVKATSGEALGGWLQWFTDISRQAQKFVLYDEETVDVIFYGAESILISDSAVIDSTGTPESRADLAHADFSETDWVH